MSAQTAVPSTNKAWRMVGKAQPLELHDDVAVAQPADDEIVVKVGVISLNPVDYKLLDYDFFDGKNPKTLSHDAAGVVVAVGKTASGTFAVGDRVVTSPKIDGPGTASEFVTVSSEKTVKVADACSLAAASTLGIAWLSAYDALHKFDVQGKTVFIPGGAGGVGHFAVQLALFKGATVISSASRADGRELLKKLGVADAHILDYKQVDVVAEVLKLTNGVGVDLSCDVTYQTTSHAQCCAATAHGGVFVSLGSAVPVADTEAGKIAAERLLIVAQADLIRYLPGKGALAPQAAAVWQNGLKLGAQLLTDNKLAPHISKTAAFADYDKAVAGVKTGGAAGKVVVVVDNDVK